MGPQGPDGAPGHVSLPVTRGGELVVELQPSRLTCHAALDDGIQVASLVSRSYLAFQPFSFLAQEDTSSKVTIEE